MIILRAITRFLFSVFLVFMILFSFLLTPYGFQSTLFITKALLPGTLHYKKIEGLLIGPITVNDLDYHDKHQQIHIHHLAFNWSPISLLRGELAIHQLSADGITVITGNSDSLDSGPSNGGVLFHLPLSLSIHNASITNIAYGQAGKPLTMIKNIDVNGVLQKNKISFSIMAQFMQPEPVQIHCFITGDFDHYHIKAQVQHHNNQITLAGVGTPKSLTMAVSSQQLASGTIQVRAQVTRYPVVSGAVTWSINVPHLDALYDGMSGSFLSQGSFHGSFASPETSGTLMLKQAVLGRLSVGSLQANWTVLFDNNQSSQVHVAASELSYQAEKVNDLKVDLQGPINSGVIHAAVNLNKNAFILNADAHRDHDSWQGAITKLAITQDTFGVWTLQKAAPFSYSLSQFYVKPVCIIGSANAFLCAQLQSTPEHLWSFALHGDKIGLANINHTLAARVQFTGKLSINATASGVGENIQQAALTSDLTPGVLTYSINNQFKNLTIQGLHIKTTIHKKTGFQARADLLLEKNGLVNASINVPQWLDSNVAFEHKKIMGNLDVSMKNLQSEFLIASVLKASIESITGQLTLDGTLGGPGFHGMMKINAPEFEYITGQMFVHRITATIEASGSKLLYQLSSYAFNNAPVMLTGSTVFNYPNIRTVLMLKTDHAELVKNNQFDFFATSNVTFTFDPKQLDISGTVFIPKALLKPIEFGNTLTMPKSNVVYIGLPNATKVEDTYRRKINLNITLGNDVFLDAYNIKANLLGNITLTASTQNTPLANGRIHLTQGSYRAYNKTLKLAPGSSISFTRSPINNPTVDARAFQYIDSGSQTAGAGGLGGNILVGVYVHGPLSNLQLSLYSQPANISQANILSYLVLGYAANGTNASSLSALLTAASTASTASGGLTQSSNLVSEIKQVLGIQDGDIGTRNQTVLDSIGNPIQSQSIFVVGHRVTNRIYVEYSRGTIIPNNVVAVRYRVNKNWSVQTTAGSGPATGTGGDVMYSFSRK